MKKLFTISVIFSLMLTTSVYAEQAYNNIRETQNSNRYTQDLSTRASENQQAWEQTIRAYQVNNNDSYTRFWDRYVDAYQKSKKIQH